MRDSLHPNRIFGSTSNKYNSLNWQPVLMLDDIDMGGDGVRNALQRCATLGLVPNARVGQRGSLGGYTRLFGCVCRGVRAQRHGVDKLAPQMRLLVQCDFGTLKAVQSVNTDQAAPTLLDDGKWIFRGPFPCDVAARRTKCSGDALVHMKQ